MSKTIGAVMMTVAVTGVIAQRCDEDRHQLSGGDARADSARRVLSSTDRRASNFRQEQ